MKIFEIELINKEVKVCLKIFILNRRIKDDPSVAMADMAAATVDMGLLAITLKVRY